MATLIILLDNIILPTWNLRLEFHHGFEFYHSLLGERIFKMVECPFGGENYFPKQTLPL